MRINCGTQFIICISAKAGKWLGFQRYYKILTFQEALKAAGYCLV